MGNTYFELKGKTYSAIELERTGGKPNKRTRVIVVPDLMYQVAQITQTKGDGEHYETRLKHFKFDEARLKALYSTKAFPP